MLIFDEKTQETISKMNVVDLCYFAATMADRLGTNRFALPSAKKMARRTSGLMWTRYRELVNGRSGK